MGLDKIALATARKCAKEIVQSSGTVQGKPGKDGNGIVSITKESSTGRIDTYKILFTDNTTTTFTVTNAITVDNLSQLNNDTGFITNTVNNLVNYYTKTDAYSKDEISNLLQNISVGLSVIVVSVLPTENINATTIYLVHEGNDNSSYEQWMYIAGQWASLGSTSINLSSYYTKTNIDNLLLGYVTTSSLITILSDYVNKSELSSVATSGSYNDLIDLPNIPTIDGLATERYVDNAINNIHNSDVGSVDLSNYYKKPETYSKEEVNNLISTVDSVISDISTNPVQNKVIKSYIDDLSFAVNKLNIAQKTVNQVGNLSLIGDPFSFKVSKSTTVGNPIATTIDVDIYLKENITNFDYIDILLSVNSQTRKRPAQITRFKVDTINYNNSSSENVSDGTILIVPLNIETLATAVNGMYNLSLIGWFKDAKTFYVEKFINVVTSTDWQDFEITDIIGVRNKSVVVDPLEYANTKSGIEDTPVGHIISHMGTIAPKHYLVCDGLEYNIVDYPYLAQHIIDNFGSVNYFGGDGTNTFAVPDLRGEFLRGTGDNSHINNTTNQKEGSGLEVGTHQDATNHISSTSAVNNWIMVGSPYGSINDNTKNYDTQIINKGVYVAAKQVSGANYQSTYTSRPTNTSVLYCIKCEPTYYMKIDGKDVYSTEERIIGYWIDGKPLYQKTIIGYTTPTTTDGIVSNTQIDVSNLHINFCISAEGLFYNSGSCCNFPMSYGATANSARLFYNPENQCVVISNSAKGYGNRDVIFTIKYTKTTD